MVQPAMPASLPTMANPGVADGGVELLTNLWRCCDLTLSYLLYCLGSRLARVLMSFVSGSKWFFVAGVMAREWRRSWAGVIFGWFFSWRPRGCLHPAGQRPPACWEFSVCAELLGSGTNAGQSAAV